MKKNFIEGFMNLSEKQDIRDLVVTSNEAINILGITRARLSQLNSTGKLTPIKKNLYYFKDIQDRKNIQGELRDKYYRPVNK